MKRLINKIFKTKQTQLPDEHWARVVMNKETKKLVEELNLQNESVLEISGTKWKSYPFNQYKSLRYPEFDVCKMILQEQFDLIIAEQVFEHLLQPHQAGRNIFQMLKPNAFFLLTTPFLIRIHEEPYDCTRWSETGIRYLLTESGFKKDCITTGSWGNSECVIANFKKWIKYNPKKHSLVNEKNFPIVIWAIAQKQ